jgi:hypothetical protein
LALGVFLNRVLQLYLSQPGPRLSYLSFPCSWNDRHASIILSYWLRWSLTHFLPQLTSTTILPISAYRILQAWATVSSSHWFVRIFSYILLHSFVSYVLCKYFSFTWLAFFFSSLFPSFLPSFLHILGKCSTTKLHLQAPILLSYWCAFFFFPVLEIEPRALRC